MWILNIFNIAAPLSGRCEVNHSKSMATTGRQGEYLQVVNGAFPPMKLTMGIVDGSEMLLTRDMPRASCFSKVVLERTSSVFQKSYWSELGVVSFVFPK